MMEFITKLYESEYFIICLFSVIAILVFTFIIVAILGRKDKSNVQENKLENGINANVAFQDTSVPATSLEVPKLDNEISTTINQPEIIEPQTTVANSEPIYESNENQILSTNNDEIIEPQSLIFEPTIDQPVINPENQIDNAMSFDATEPIISEESINSQPVLTSNNEGFKFETIFEPVESIDSNNLEQTIAPIEPVIEPIITNDDPIVPIEQQPTPITVENISNNPIEEVSNFAEPAKTTIQNQFSSVFIEKPLVADTVVEPEIELPKEAAPTIEEPIISATPISEIQIEQQPTPIIKEPEETAPFEPTPVIEVTPENVFPSFEPETYQINDKEQ